MRNNEISEVMKQAEEKITERDNTSSGQQGRIDKVAESAGASERKSTGVADKTDALSGQDNGTAGQPETSDTKGGGGKRKDSKQKVKEQGSWIRWGLLVSVALAVIMISMYGFFRSRAEEYRTSPLEYYDNIAWLYQSSYLLYKDLYNAQSDEQKGYNELYFRPGDGYEWMVSPDAWDETIDDFQERYDSLSAGEEESSFYTVRDGLFSIENFFQTLEDNFGTLNGNYDYVIRDNKTGFYLTNMSDADLQRNEGELFFQVSFVFNEHGVATVGDQVRGVDAAQIRKLANEAIRSNSLESSLAEDRRKELSRYGVISGPVDCTVVFCVSEQDWASGRAEARYMQRVTLGDMRYVISPTEYVRSSQGAAYRDAHMGVFLLALLTAALLCGLFLPVAGGWQAWNRVKICRLPLEAILAAGIVLFGGIGGWIFDLAVYTAGNRMMNTLYESLIYDHDWARILSVLINLICLTAFFFCGWYLGICARAVRDLGVKEYIKQKCIFYQIFPFIKGKIMDFYDELCHFDVTRNAHKMILKIVFINAVILFVISCFWVPGFPLTIAYSVLLYVILRNYISKLQKKYGQLLHATNEIAEGNLNVKITEDLGVFEPFKPQIIRIQNGFMNAVEEETKSQRMKAELITNVSHDLKTPLTAIITYINLLKDENITEQQRKEYLDTLERKSLRLKVLIEDLFEVSKANSQTITLNIMDVDIMNLVKQVSFEMADKLEASGLDVRMNLTEEKIILPLDSQKTYRIYENLMGNIAKYALPGTRVYINGFRIDDTVIITMKNISAQEITVDTAELTERFVRGDASRNTEGSGLGLAIAKSFMELQGGELSLEVDGDLFKATTTWHMSPH